LDTTPKLPISISLVRQFPRKVGKRPNSIPFYTFEVKSALNSTQEQKPFSKPAQHIAASFHARLLNNAGKHSITGKELHYRSLGHNPQFQLSISLILSATLERNPSFQS
tara:strand:- start:439 stop:765 length:327 start_codon:yes stop_codon:yes gene_type:complete